MPEEAASAKAGIAWMLLGLLLALIFTNILFRGGDDREGSEPSGQPIIQNETNALHVISQVQPFSLVNQDNQTVTLTNLLGKPWLADIIFTRCPTFCPVLTKTMGGLREGVGDNITFVSLTTDPGFDTPSVLKAFAATNECDTANWHFLTGPKADLMKLAVDDLKFVSLPVEEAKRTNPNDLFVHSSAIMLVDARGRLRGKFDYEATNLVEQVQTALRQLKAEP